MLYNMTVEPRKSTLRLLNVLRLFSRIFSVKKIIIKMIG